ncbi:MAG: ATP-dependent RecD-like DNA helicase [Alphaproteobacteria bacterium]
MEILGTFIGKFIFLFILWKLIFGRKKEESKRQIYQHDKYPETGKTLNGDSYNFETEKKKIESVKEPKKELSKTLNNPKITPKEEVKLDNIQQNIFNKIEKDKKNIFIQGQAGTGKSTFIKYLKENSDKKIVIACPTAVAAINIGGSTIHSIFQIPPKDFIILDSLELKRKPSQILKNADLLIIDEVSMVRPDMLDAIDFLSKKARNSKKPFGGMQIILIGDLCQLPPVITRNVYGIFQKEYGYMETYFFDAKSYKDGNFENVEFKKVYRQEDLDLLKHLENIRKNFEIYDTVEYFNSAKIRDENILKTAITITPKRAVAEYINNSRLSSLNGDAKTYSCFTSGKFAESDYPAPGALTLKKGALIMFNKNNSPSWINGSSGIIEKLGDNEIDVKLSNGNIVSVKREEWKKFEYEHNLEENKIKEKEIGSFRQFPLQLGYALTIHKAQGKTLDKVIIELDKTGAFAHGQMYVALSRTRKFSDMHIKYNIDETDIILDKRVLTFLEKE